MLFHPIDPAAPSPTYARLWVVRAPEVGLEAIVAIDSLRRGPAFGGVRRRRYPHEAAALRDALELARAMTLKCALAALPAGGAKAVMLDRPGLELAGVYRALGQAIDELGGRYVCGPDLGTGPEELELLRSATAHVNPAGNDAGRSTAWGVLAALRGLGRHLDGEGAFAGRRYLIQGLGAVGRRVAEGLVAGGAAVWAHDPDPAARAFAEALGIGWLGEEELFRRDAEVFVPCAVGGVLDLEAAERIPVRAVCGSANNPLADPSVAARLWARGVIFVPDVISSAGAVIEGVRTVLGWGADPGPGAPAPHAGIAGRIAAEIAEIEARTFDLLRRAAERGRCPLELALEAGRRLEGEGDAADRSAARGRGS